MEYGFNLLINKIQIVTTSPGVEGINEFKQGDGGFHTAPFSKSVC